MEKYSKFIIEDGWLILGKVTYHEDLMNDKTKVKGGGWYRYSKSKDTIIFFGSSFDLGSASLEDIRAAVQAGKVVQGKDRLAMKLASKYAYNTGTEIIEL